jgi:hypothetical protein
MDADLRMKVKIKKKSHGGSWTLTMVGSGGSKYSPGGSIDQWSQIRDTLTSSRIPIWIFIKVRKAGFGSAIKLCGSATLHFCN